MYLVRQKKIIVIKYLSENNILRLLPTSRQLDSLNSNKISGAILRRFSNTEVLKHCTAYLKSDDIFINIEITFLENHDRTLSRLITIRPAVRIPSHPSDRVTFVYKHCTTSNQLVVLVYFIRTDCQYS